MKLRDIALGLFLTVAPVLSADSKYFEYKIRFPFVKGNFTYEENYDNKNEIVAKIELGGIIKKIKKEYKSYTIDDKIFYEENEKTYELDINPTKRDFLGILSSFMEYAAGDSVEKHYLFKNEDEPFRIFIDGEWRSIKSVSPETVKIKYNKKEIEALHVPLYSQDFPTKFDLFIYDKKIVKIRIRLKIGINLWADLVEEVKEKKED